MKQLLSYFSLILISGATVFAQGVEFGARLNRQVVGLNEQFELLLDLAGADAGDVPQPPVPDVNGFARFIGSSQSSNFQFINGRMNTSKTYTLHFIATREGKFQIPKIEFSHDGKNYVAGPLAIEIIARRSPQPQTTTPSQGGGRSSNGQQEDLSELLYLSATVDKKRVYLNEPVVITYRIYTALNVTNYGISQIPSTVGFWSEDFDTGKRPAVYSETVKGREYRVAVIKKMALYPQSAGKKELGAMVVDCEVQVPARKRSSDPFDLFGDSFFRRTVTRTISSNLTTIDVLPLPKDSKPADFSGLVGRFDITASVDKTTTKTNEAITLKAKISGVGNVKIIPQPNFDIPADFESYEPKIQENIQRDNNKISGSKIFEYVLIPRFAGQHKIKPISLSFFDPALKAYRSVSTDAIDITVEKGADQFTGVGIATSKEDVRFIGQDIRFIQTRLPDFKKQGIVIYKRWYFFTLLVLPWLAVAFVWISQRHKDKMLSNVAYARSRKASQMASRFLKNAHKKMTAGNPREFYSEVSKALLGFFADKFNVAAAGLITDHVQELMRGRNVSGDTISSYIGCLETCDYQRFAPSNSDNGEMQAFLEQAKNAIIDLDKAL